MELAWVVLELEWRCRTGAHAAVEDVGVVVADEVARPQTGPAPHAEDILEAAAGHVVAALAAVTPDPHRETGSKTLQFGFGTLAECKCWLQKTSNVINTDGTWTTCKNNWFQVFFFTSI